MNRSVSKAMTLAGFHPATFVTQWIDRLFGYLHLPDRIDGANSLAAKCFIRLQSCDNLFRFRAFPNECGTPCNFACFPYIRPDHLSWADEF